MMLYDFECPDCGERRTVQASIHDGPEAQTCQMCFDQPPMRRLYGAQAHAVIQLGVTDYIDKAYRGEEPVPGLTTRQVRAIVDSQVTTSHRGRANNARRR